MFTIEIYPLLCVFVPNIIWQILNRGKIREESRGNRIRHFLWTYVFWLYLYLAVYSAAGIGTFWDLLAYGELDNTVNLIPFNSEGYLTYLLNVIMFMPLGFLLPLIWKDWRSLRKTVLTGAFLSLAIELCQMLCLRATDIDDLMMNTLGTAAGFCIWVLFHRIFPGSGERSVSAGRWEPAWYIGLSVLGIVFLFNWRWYIKFL